MAYFVETVVNYKEYLNRLRQRITGLGVVGTVTYNGTGNGTLEGVESKVTAVDETWTLTCTTAGGNGTAVFSVTGSVSGAQPDATAGGLYTNPFLEFAIVAGSTPYSVGDAYTVPVTENALTAAGQNWALHRWTGLSELQGSLSGLSNLTDGSLLTKATAGGTTGQVEIHYQNGVQLASYRMISGQLAADITGMPRDWVFEYSDDGVNWTVVDTRTGVSWQGGVEQVFTIGGAPGRHLMWRLSITNTNGTSISIATLGVTLVNDTIDALEHPLQCVLEGPGLAGVDHIFVGWLSAVDATAPYYNVGFVGMQQYDNTQTVDQQVDASPPVYSCLDNGAFEYRLSVNGRRFITTMKIGGLFGSAYCGFILPYALPTEYPYPLLISANDQDSNTLLSNTTGSYRGCFDPGVQGAYLRTPGGVWETVENHSNNAIALGKNIWPYVGSVGIGTHSEVTRLLRDGPGGEKVLLPLIIVFGYISAVTQSAAYGELDGLFFVSGFNTLPEDAITVGADTYRAIPSIFRSDFEDFAALKEA